MTILSTGDRQAESSAREYPLYLLTHPTLL